MTNTEARDVLVDIDTSETPEVAGAVSLAVKALELHDRLKAYLSELQVAYTPEGIRNGKWIGGDEKLFLFAKNLGEQIDRW